MKPKWYSLDNINKVQSQYKIIVGRKSNGKTEAVLTQILQIYHDTGKQGGLIRRYIDFIKAPKRSTIFDDRIRRGKIKDRYKDTKEQWTGVVYRHQRFFLAKTIESPDGKQKPIIDQTPFRYVFALSSTASYDENQYPGITTIFFDEMRSRNGYLPQEFVKFQVLISDIKRDRQDVTIYMVGNTINQYGCPYFLEMGLQHIDKIPLGKIELYTYGESELRVAVEHADNVRKINSKKDVDPYFAFDNPHLQMITGGEWERDIYPHCPYTILPKEIIYKYFIRYEGGTYQCEIVHHDNDWFTYIHRKTTEIKDCPNEIIFQKEAVSQPRYRSKLSMPFDDIGRNLYLFFQMNKVFYQDNSVGEAIRNYLLWCNSLNG